MEQAAATAPWVEFKKVPVEDRNASVEAGSYIAVDVDYAYITPAGSKDCVEKPVKEWFEGLQQQVEAKRFPPEWLRAFRNMYEAWQKSEEMPVEGTSVKNWSVASPAQIEMLLKLHIRTVEALAQANEEVIGRLGMGGRNLVDKAKAYIQQGTSGVGKLAEENANLKASLEASKKTVTTLEEQMKLMQSQIQALQGMQAGALAAASAVDTSAQTSASAVTLTDLLDTAKPAQPTARKL